MSKIPVRDKKCPYKVFGNHQKFLSRITKSLYYGRLLKTDNLSIPVTELAAELFSEAQRGRSLDLLHYDKAAVVSRNTCASPCSLILALLYLERLKTYNPDYLKKVAPSELFLISLMVSSKFLYDDGEGDEVFTDEWAASGGVSAGEVVQLERDFLSAIDWKVFVNESMFWKKLKSLETILAEREGTKRGWFTYTELQNLLDYIDAYVLIQKLACLMAILAVAYTAGILAMVGSVVVTKRIVPLPQSVNVSQQILSTEKNVVNRNLDAADVLKTGIFLASIKVCNNSRENADVGCGSWDWWNNPVMQWLGETSQLLEDVEFPFEVKTENRFLEADWVLSKKIELEDHIDKATKIRIQEQLERSWHKEWTDSVFRRFGDVKLLLYYFRDVKS